MATHMDTWLLLLQRGDIFHSLTYLLLSLVYLLFYNEIMINRAHDFGLFITVEGFSKVRYAGTPLTTKKSFAFQGRRKQRYKEIGKAGGVA
jgi:hypothetical protein